MREWTVLPYKRSPHSPIVSPSSRPHSRYGEQVGERLRGMTVPPVARVDDGDAGFCRGDERRALDGMPYGDDIRIVAHDADGIPHAFALGGGGGRSLREADDASAQLQHRRLEREAGARGRLEKERRQLFSLSGFRIVLPVRGDVFRESDEFVDFRYREIGDVQKMSHFTLIQLSSEGLFRNAMSRATSSFAIYPSSAATSASVSKSERL